MNQNKWHVYEQRKADLRKQNLTNEQYQAAIRALVEELGI